MDSGLIAPNDQYFAQVTATTFGNSVQTNLANLRVMSGDILVIANETASPSTFSPDEDGVNDTTNISYTLSDLRGSTFALVSIDVFADQAGTARTRRLVTNVSRPTDNSLQSQVWDGKNDLGQTIPNGDYFYQITGADSFGLVTKTGLDNQHKIAVQQNVIGINNVSANPASFSPDGDGIEDVTAISYLVSDTLSPYPVTVDVKIFSDQTGTQLVRYLVRGATIAAGMNQVHTWTGTNDSGQNVADGTYFFQVKAVDSLGYSAQTVISNATKITVNGLYVFAISNTPDPFSPNGDGLEDDTAFDSLSLRMLTSA